MCTFFLRDPPGEMVDDGPPSWVVNCHARHWKCARHSCGEPARTAISCTDPHRLSARGVPHKGLNRKS